MKWMKAGRPRKNPVDKPATPSQEPVDNEKYTRKELMLFTDGYVALAAAVINQCRKDHVKEEPQLFHDILDCYADSMVARIGDYSIGEQEEEL